MQVRLNTTQPVAPATLRAMIIYATDLVQAHPTANPGAISDKLLTVFEGTPQRTRLEVALWVGTLFEQLAA